MKKLRVLSIFGTRPEAVKLAPVILELERTAAIESFVCVTAQHRQMLDQVLTLFNIIPDEDLDLMQPDQSLSQITAAVFTHLDPVLKQLKPDWVLVQGDTTTVMAASLLAFYQRILIGHVEAGLRTNDKWQPFPEEINRRIAGVIADLHFAPTDWARNNLLKEGVPPDQIVVTGNPVIDALNQISSLPVTSEVSNLISNLGLPDLPGDTIERGRSSPHLILVTAHRRENFGQPLEDICLGILRLAKTYQDQVKIVYPVHLNPNVQEPVHRILGDTQNVHLLPPLDYFPLIHLMKRATLILTDSGGIQEEAPGLGVPVLVLRRVTERPEGVQAGVVKLIGTDRDRIYQETRALLDNPQLRAQMAQAVNPYGDGFAAQRIVRSILEYNKSGSKVDRDLNYGP